MDDVRFIKKPVQLWGASDAEDFSLDGLCTNISKEPSSLWTEKYRPKTMNEYYINDFIIGEIDDWIKGFINKTQIIYKPVLLLHGTAGIGKTTLAHLIFQKI